MARRNFLAYFFLTSCLVSGQSPRYVLKGQKVTLKKDITGQPDNILWKHNGNKVLEFNGREEHVYDPYKSRVTLDWLSAELDISDLRLEDSGKYELEVFVNKKLEKSYHDVEILERVAKPSISCKINNSNNSGSLVCSAEPRQPVHLMKIEWHSQGNVHPGPHLQISLGNELDEQVYSCMVSNPLTTETAAFTAKDCYPTKSSSAALIAIAVAISLLLLIAGVGILFCYKKRKGCFAKRQTDVENQKPYTTQGSGGTVETDEAKPLIDGKSSSGKSSVGAFRADRGAAEEEQLIKSADEQQAELKSPTVVSPGKVGNLRNFFEEIHDTGRNKDDINNKNITAANKQERPPESADVNQDTSSEQKSSTAPASPVIELDPSNTDKSEVLLENASDPAAVEPVTGPDSVCQHDPECSSTSGLQPAQNSTCQPAVNLSSLASSGSLNQIQNSSSGLQNSDKNSSSLPGIPQPDKNVHHASDDSSVQKDSDGQQLNGPTEEEKPQGAGDPKPSEESDDGHKDVSSPTASDGSALDQNSTENQNNEASSSSDASQNKDDINDKNTTVEDPLGKDPDKQEGHASNKSESPAESADVNQNTSSEQKSSPAPSSPEKVLDPSNNDKSDSDSEEPSKDPLENASGPAAVRPVTGPDSEPESADKNVHHASDDSSVQKDSDGQQLNGPTEEEKPQGAGDPKPSEESDDGHKDVSSPTASDGSALDQNSTENQNNEASSSSDAGQNKDDINDKNTTVEAPFGKDPDKQEGHASNKSESPAESADVNQNTSSEQKSSPAPSSPEKVLDPSNNDKSDSDSEEPSKDPLENASGPAAVRPVTGPDSEPESADKNVHHASDDSSVQKDSDGQQLNGPTEEEKPQGAGDPKPSEESDDGHKDVSSPTASDGSALDQNSTENQNNEASSSSDAGQNKDDINDKNTTVEAPFGKDPDKQEGHASNKSESPAESADVNQNTSSEQKSSPAPSSPEKVLDPSNNDKSDSDSEEPSKDPLENASGPAAVRPVTGPDSEPESADKNVHHASDDSSVQKDSDGQQLNGPTEEEKPQGAGDPKPSEESDDGHKDVSSPTASDGSALDQNSTENQNNEASSSSDAGQNKDDINDKNTTVEDPLGKDPDKQEGHASNKSESPAESADVNQNTSSEQKSSTAPSSPEKVLDPSNNDKSDSDSEEPSKDPLENASGPAAVRPVTGPDSEPESAASDNSKHPPSDNSSVQNLSDVQQLSKSADREKQQGAGDPDLSDESADSSEDVGSEVNSPTDIRPGLVKRRSKKFQPHFNTTDRDASEEEQLSGSADEETHQAELNSPTVVSTDLEKTDSE